MSGMHGWTLDYSGKVRDLYVSSDRPGEVLMVASDRVSAFDYALEPGIPGKGELLTTLCLWWFARLADIPNHLVSANHLVGANHLVRPDDPDAGIPDEVAGRALIAKTLEMYPIECVVRGYLTGSGWAEYRESQSVCGVSLPAGLSDGDRLPEPIYTPAWKAPLGEHDENISFERTVELVGGEVAGALRDRSLEVFARASEIAEQRGLLLADTKFEFGADPATGELTLADEVLTSDSSRYWDAAEYAAGRPGVSFDKQIVRDWLSAHWDRTGAPPELPPEIVERTALRYRELIERLTAV